MLDRAFSILTVKSIDGEQRRFRGLASSPVPDRLGDVVEPLGMSFTNPLPLLLHHDKTRPIGHATFLPPTSRGVEFEAVLPNVTEPGPLRDRIEEAWQSIRYGLIRGVSIGFRPLKDSIETLKSGGLRFKHIEVLELSAVVVPAHQLASISVIRSLDQAAASGAPGRAVHPAGAAALPHPPMTYSEQIQTLQTDLQTKSSQLEDYIRRDEAEGGLNADEAKERDTLTAGIKSLTAQVDRLKVLEAAQQSMASPVSTTGASVPAGKSTPTRVQVVTPELAKGTLFARYAMAVAAGRGSLSDTIAYAKRWETQTPEVVAYIKAEAGSSVAASPGWGSELVYQGNLASEFVELLRPATIIGRMNGIRRVPFNVRIPVQTGGSTVNWVGESAVKPVTELEFTTLTLGYDKIAGIVVLTDELVRLSSPSAEETVRRDLVDQIAQFMDAQFVDPNVAAGANNPASITYGVAPTPVTGTTAAAFYADLKSALATFDAANLSTGNLVLLMPPAVARGLAALRSDLGVAEFPNLTITGGSIMGFEVIVSGSVPALNIILVNTSEILLADDGRVTLDASNQATLDMNGGTSPNFSLWQRNCIGIRAERWVTWAKRRATAVAILSPAAYAPTPVE